MAIRSRNAKGRRALLKTLRKRDGDRCYICNDYMLFEDRNRPDSATFDHIIPKSVGGNNRCDNLKLAHKQCNQSRGQITEQLYPWWTMRQLPSR